MFAHFPQNGIIHYYFLAIAKVFGLLLLDNSALFLGVRSDSANISRLVFSSSFPQQGLAINKMSIIAVPEASSTLAILVFGVSGAIWKFRRSPNAIT